MKKRFFLVTIAVISFCVGANAQLFGKKVKTINVIPDNAKIIIRGDEVAVGNYDLTMGRQDEYVLIKLEAPGYIEKTVKVYKNDSRKTLTYKLDVDDSYAASDVSSDLANKNFTVVVREGMSEEEAWRSIIYYITDLFPNMEITDNSAGWIRSAWEIQSFAYSTIRTRIEIKRVPGQTDLKYRVNVKSEYAWNECGLDDKCFRHWDRLL